MLGLGILDPPGPFGSQAFLHFDNASDPGGMQALAEYQARQRRIYVSFYELVSLYDRGKVTRYGFDPERDLWWYDPGHKVITLSPFVLPAPPPELGGLVRGRGHAVLRTRHDD